MENETTTYDEFVKAISDRLIAAEQFGLNPAKIVADYILDLRDFTKVLMEIERN